MYQKVKSLTILLCVIIVITYTTQTASATDSTTNTDSTIITNSTTITNATTNTSSTTNTKSTTNAIRLNRTLKTLAVGSSYSLKLSDSEVAVTWSSSDKTIVTVNSSGKITAKKSGVAYVYAKFNSKKLSCKVISRKDIDRKFDTLIENSGFHYNNINSEQILIVKSNGSKATIYYYEVNEKGIWAQTLSTYSGYIGKKSVTKYKKEGDLKTPQGLFSLDYAFGNKPFSDTRIKYRNVTKHSYWVDDSTSRYYNKWVEGTSRKDWNSAEYLSSMPSSYAYAIAVGYNTNPIIRGKGSAIFIHCGSVATSGCIATATTNVKAIIKELEKSKNPKVLIY